MKVRTEAKRELILEIAAAVFLAEGFEGASMSEIARRVGGSKATLYGYFPSKEDLFLGVVQAEADRQLGAAETQMAATAVGNMREALMCFAQAAVTFSASDAANAAHRMVLGAAGRSDIGKTFYESGPKPGLERLAAVLQAAMDRGELRQADAWIAVQQLGALINAEMLPRWFYRDPPALSPDDIASIAERAIDTFWRAYRP